MNLVYTVLGVLGFLFLLTLISIPRLIFICAPNEVLIFSGRRRRDGARTFGYRLIKGGRSLRVPLIERVDRMDLTNMVIDVTAQNAYSKGGIPLTVQGVANVKIAGFEPVLNNAIERFLTKSRIEVMEIAKATLEGSLRGILATLTPEQVNDDKIAFAERLVQEVEQDMTDLGLVVDTLKIQNVQDEVKYLDSIGRKKNAEMISAARIAEAGAKADAGVRASENMEREVRAQITAKMEIAKAEAGKRLVDARTRREAVVAEERSTVVALVAQAKAEVEVQKARIEQVRRKLEADVVAPAKAQCEAAEQAARAAVANIVEEGTARADALRTLSESWKAAGDQARQLFVIQKLEPIIEQITATIGAAPIQKMTVIDPRTTSGSGASPTRLLALAEQFKEVLGVDLIEKIRALAEPKATPPQEPAP